MSFNTSFFSRLIQNLALSLLFQLPDPAGQAGGACTSVLLNVCYADHHQPEVDLSFVEVLMQMRDILADRGYTQIPQLTSTQPVDVNAPFSLVPADFEGTARAVLVGINYVGHEQGELSGCHNDALNMKDYIMDVYGFKEENITVLLDDGEHTEPNKENILEAYRTVVAQSEPGDAIFCHYSGHGGKLKDDDASEEDDGYDETLVPLDYQQVGFIRDDDLFDILVKPLPEGVMATFLMDCCHSGTVLDLPYKFKPNGEFEEMEITDGYDFNKLFSKLGETVEDVYGEEA